MNMTFAGRDAVNVYVAVALKHGLLLYHRTGMKPNRAWTPTAMLRKASEITGKRYKRGDYERAARDIDAMLPATGE